MKRLFVSVLVIVMLWLLPVVGMAVNSPIMLFLNGHKVLDEPVPMIVDSYAYIELHTFARELNIGVYWEASTKQATLKHGNKQLVLTIDQRIATVNGQEVSLVAAPFMSGEYIYLPLYFVGEQLGIKSNWDALTQSLMLYQKDRKFSNSEETDQLGGSVQEPLLPDQLGQPLSVITGMQMSGDTIQLQLSERVQPSSFYLTDPDRLVIDLPNSQLGQALIGPQGRQGGELGASHTAIQGIRYAQHDEITVRLVVDLKHKGALSTTYDEHGRLLIEWIGQSYTVVIDPGHGGRDPGADGASGRYEKHFTLELSERIVQLLADEPNIHVHVTRTEDETVSLEERIKMGNALYADAFVSIHGNTHTSKVSGTETFYWQAGSKQLAETLHAVIVKDGTQLRDRGVKRERYRLLTDDASRGVTMKGPAVLIELGYLSNAEEEQLMLSTAFQDRVAKAVVKGLKQYFGLE